MVGYHLVFVLAALGPEYNHVIHGVIIFAQRLTPTLDRAPSECGTLFILFSAIIPASVPSTLEAFSMC